MAPCGRRGEPARGAPAVVCEHCRQPVRVRVLRLDRSRLLLGGRKFNKLWVRCRLRADGTAAAAALVVNMSFKAEWINPAWDLAGFRVDTQSERIAARLHSIVAALPPVDGNLMALDDATLKAELGATLSWKAMLPRKSVVASFLLVGALVSALAAGRDRRALLVQDFSARASEQLANAQQLISAAVSDWQLVEGHDTPGVDEEQHIS